MGADRLEYQGEVSTKTAVLTTIKLLLNSVVSSIWAKFITEDVKHFYLNIPMEEPEYMKIPVRLTKQYKTQNMVGSTIYQIGLQKNTSTPSSTQLQGT